MNKELLKDIVDEIKEAANELYKKGERKDMIEQGELIAYAEVLNIIQDTFAGYDLSDIGIDFDIDKKYLE